MINLLHPPPWLNAPWSKLSQLTTDQVNLLQKWAICMIFQLQLPHRHASFAPNQEFLTFECLVQKL